MRRMRDFQWRYILFPLLVGTSAIGVFLWTRETDDITHAPPKVPVTVSKEAHVAEPEKTSEPSSLHSKEVVQEEAVKENADVTNRVPSSEIAVETPEVPPQKSDLKDLAQKATSKVASIPDENSPIGNKLSEKSVSPEKNVQACAALEYSGDSPELLVLNTKEWSLVMKEFHWAKAELVRWLNQNGKHLPQTTLSPMIAMVKNMRIQRPPAPDEPDLSWRGIGVLTQDESGAPLIRVGAGFLSLIKRNPERARFEMVRLVAQTWSPCELKTVGMPFTPWKGFLSCLGFEEFASCQAGSYSEPGWAVSSALANTIANPKCEIPAFQNSSAQLCLKNFSSTQEVAHR